MFSDHVGAVISDSRASSIGFLPVGVNEGETPQSFTIEASQQFEGLENVISFEQARNVTWKCGVTDILIEDLIV
jgi:hypothetical protein